MQNGGSSRLQEFDKMSRLCLFAGRVDLERRWGLWKSCSLRDVDLSRVRLAVAGALSKNEAKVSDICGV